MAFNGSGCSRSTSGTAERELKKTPWTPVEDNILKEYVEKHGEGNWGSIQEVTGLDKSGKSCRNRWVNYLRPNLKKGAFSAEEENLIIELHAIHGNKWARIAAQLGGRTDNEVKNYWNMRVKRCRRAGLAVHPQEMCQKSQPSSSSPLPIFSSYLASFPPQDPNRLCSSNSIPSPSRSNKLLSSPALVTVPPAYQILPNSLPSGDFQMMESESVQGLENKDSRDSFRFLDDKLWKLLDAPLSAPIPEWDDLHPRPF